MNFHGRDYGVRLELDAEDVPHLALYEGTMAVGAPVAECWYDDGEGSLSVRTFAVDVPSTALDWFREEAQRRLPPPGTPLPAVDAERASLWYYAGGTLVLAGSVLYRWRHVAAHGGIETALLAVAAGLLLVTGYWQHRSERLESMRDLAAYRSGRWPAD